MRTIFLLLLLLVPFLVSCDQMDNFPKAATSGGSSNPGINSPSSVVSFDAANWRLYAGDVGNQSNPNQYQHTLVTSTSSSPSTPIIGTGLGGLSSRASSCTLGLAASTIIDTASYCYWAYRFYPPTTLRIGQSLRLTAKIKLDNVQEKGVSLVLRGDRKGQSVVLFASMEGKLPLNGTADYTTYSVTLPYTTGVGYFIVCFLLLSNTTGTATCTDVSVAIQ